MKKNAFLFAGKENRRIFTPVITTKANKMTTTKLRKGEYQITIGGRTLDLINDICIETGKNQGWILYNEQGEWMGSADTKKKLVQALKNS